MIVDKNGNVLTVTFDDVAAGWSKWMLLSSDRHHDHPKSNPDLEEHHFQQARERNAHILDFGDLFCAMQSTGDKRGSKSSVRSEDSKDNYLDRIVNNAAEFYARHADLFLLIGKGNHETAILKYKETDLTNRLVERLQLLNPKCQAHVGGFSGWVRFQFRGATGGSFSPINLAYHHGYGGDAPVTKGVIQTNRMAVYLPDADIVVSGHTHNEWYFPISRLRLSEKGRVHKDIQWHYKLPSYKDEYGDGSGGWEIERGAPPKTHGAMWLRFMLKPRKGSDSREVIFEASPAKDY